MSLIPLCNTTKRIEHLNYLWHRLKLENIDALLLYGAMGTKMKREQFAQTSDASIILSTSSYIGEGIDIGHLDTVVFTMPISYDERMVHYLGRIGRQGQECLAIDFIDHEVPLLKSSFTKRLKGYKKMGYHIGINAYKGDTINKSTKVVQAITRRKVVAVKNSAAPKKNKLSFFNP